jgi:glycosyltransferase involved in cell wall biosynthesis
VLVFAYACEPRRGSEPGIGWTMTRALAEVADVWVLTRFGRQEPVIAETLPHIPERDRINIEFVHEGPLLRRLRFAENGEYGRLHYLMWLWAALRYGRKLHRRIGFDVVWHLTFSTIWMGATAGFVGPPFVLGPIGGGVGMTWRHAPFIGPRGVLYEIARSAARSAGRYANPLSRVAWRSANVILANNEDTLGWLPASAREKSMLLSYVTSDEPPVRRAPRPADRPPTAVFAGRLIPWKGTIFAIEALRYLPEWRLVLYGDGPDRGRLARRAARLGVADRVVFAGWTDRAEILRALHEDADVFLFPSLHDEGGYVVMEALSREVPVVCVNRGGPPVLMGDCGIAVEADRSSTAVVRSLAQACIDITQRGIEDETYRANLERFTLTSRSAELGAVIDRVLER